MKHQVTKAALALLALSMLMAIVSRPVVGQGLLTPPGPPVPMMKTLDQIESRTPVDALHTPGGADSLFTIAQPGSYYLTGNITGVSNKHGIEIATDKVTLDLRGFELVGIAGSLDGVFVSVAASDYAIRDGAIRGWGGCGFNAALGNNGLAQNLRVSGNGSDGIRTGTGWIITGCASSLNYGDGFEVTDSATVTDCTAVGNRSDGIDVNSGSTVSRFTALQNRANGIRAGWGTAIIGCTVSSNASDGIRASTEATITDCTATYNGSDGIDVLSNCRVVGNHCSKNSIGIWTSGDRNRIDSNFVVGNTNYGVRVEGRFNLIVRNQAGGSTVAGANFSIAGTPNIIGQILGSSLGANLTVTSGSGWENFTGEPVQ